MLSKGNDYIGLASFTMLIPNDILIPAFIAVELEQWGINSYNNLVFKFFVAQKLELLTFDGEEYAILGSMGVNSHNVLIDLNSGAIKLQWQNIAKGQKIIFVNNSYKQFVQTMAYVDFYTQELKKIAKKIDMEENLTSLEPIPNQLVNIYQTLRQDVWSIDKAAFEGLNFWPCSIRILHEHFSIYEQLGEKNPFTTRSEFYNFFLPSELCFDENSPF